MEKISMTLIASVSRSPETGPSMLSLPWAVVATAGVSSAGFLIPLFLVTVPPFLQEMSLQLQVTLVGLTSHCV